MKEEELAFIREECGGEIGVYMISNLKPYIAVIPTHITLKGSPWSLFMILLTEKIFRINWVYVMVSIKVCAEMFFGERLLFLRWR